MIDIEFIEAGEDWPAACPPQYIGTGELARKTGVSQHYLRRWSNEGLVPCSRPPGHNRMFPEHEATAAVKGLIRAGRLDRKTRR